MMGRTHPPRMAGFFERCTEGGRMSVLIWLLVVFLAGVVIWHTRGRRAWELGRRLRDQKRLRSLARGEDP
jgi:uncharacterized membrane protein YbhN (UPF0104 family)